MDLAIIGTAFSHLKTSMEIAKLIKDSSSSLSEAETKLKLAELISSLADLKIELANVKVDLIEKDELIRELKKGMDERESLFFDGKFYWKKNDKRPFCPTCWESNKKAIHLIFKTSFDYAGLKKFEECQVCNTTYLI